MSIGPLAIFVNAVLFDLDGVLVDSDAIVVRTWNRWAARHSLDIPDLVRRAHGRRSIETIRDVAPTLDAEAEARWLDAAELADTEGLKIMPGAAELFASTPPHARAVVTSCGRALAELRLTAAGLDPPDVLIAAEDIRNGKPAPDGYLLAAERLGVNPRSCVVFEDAPAGIAAARAAGAMAIAVATTFPAADLQYADIVIPSLRSAAVLSDDDGIRLQLGGDLQVASLLGRIHDADD